MSKADATVLLLIFAVVFGAVFLAAGAIGEWQRARRERDDQR